MQLLLTAAGNRLAFAINDHVIVHEETEGAGRRLARLPFAPPSPPLDDDEGDEDQSPSSILFDADTVDREGGVDVDTRVWLSKDGKTAFCRSSGNERRKTVVRFPHKVVAFARCGRLDRLDFCGITWSFEDNKTMKVFTCSFSESEKTESDTTTSVKPPTKGRKTKKTENRDCTDSVKYHHQESFLSMKPEFYDRLAKSYPHREVFPSGTCLSGEKAGDNSVWTALAFGRRLFLLHDDRLLISDLSVPHHVSCISATVETTTTTDQIILACGTYKGKIFVVRLFIPNSPSSSSPSDRIVTEMHWHAGPVTALAFADAFHLLSGGNEGVLVLWRVSEATTASRPTSFLPRLGSGVRGLACLPPRRATACHLLLAEGVTLEVALPGLTPRARTRLCLPPTSTCIAYCVPKDRLAFAVDEHRPGVVFSIRPRALAFGASLEEVYTSQSETIWDVLGRNPVSNADPKRRWRVEYVRFDEREGNVAAAVVRMGETADRSSSATPIEEDLASEALLCRRELRVFVNEREVLRAALGIAAASPSLSTTSYTSPKSSSKVRVTSTSVAVFDPLDGGSKLRIFSRLNAEGRWGVERILDLSPARIQDFSLSEDDSAVCVALRGGGAIRVYSRTGDGGCVGKPTPTGEERKTRVGFAPGDHVSSAACELYVWTDVRMRAEVRGEEVRLERGNNEIVHALPLALRRGLAVLIRDKKTGEVSLWVAFGERGGNGDAASTSTKRKKTKVVVEEEETRIRRVVGVESDQRWKKILGYSRARREWILRTTAGGVEVRSEVENERTGDEEDKLLSEFALASSSSSRKPTERPLVGDSLYLVDSRERETAEENAASSTTATASFLASKLKQLSEWSTDVPTHLLPRAPPRLSTILSTVLLGVASTTSTEGDSTTQIEIRPTITREPNREDEDDDDDEKRGKKKMRSAPVIDLNFEAKMQWEF